MAQVFNIDTITAAVDTGPDSGRTDLDKLFLTSMLNTDLAQGLFLDISDANPVIGWDTAREARTWGAGAGSAVDLYLQRVDSNGLALRNAADTLYRDLDIRSLTGVGTLSMSGLGPHLIGGTAVNYYRFRVGGSFTSGGGSSVAAGFTVDGALTGAPGDTGWLTMAAFLGSVTTQITDAVTIVSQVRIQEPLVIVGVGGSVVNTATLHVVNAADEGTNNYAILVGAGVSRFNDEVWLGAADKLYLDGGLNTYIWEVAADIIEVVRNDVAVARFDSSGLSIIGSNDFSVPAAGRVGLDGSAGHSYLHELSNDIVELVVGGVALATFDETTDSFAFAIAGGAGAIQIGGRGSQSEFCFVAPDFQNGTGPGNNLALGRNADSSTPAAASITFEARSALSSIVWVDVNDDMRIRLSTLPTFSGDGAGIVLGTQTSWHEKKKDIQPAYMFSDLAAERLGAVELQSYRFKHDGQRRDKLMHGFVIDEAARSRDCWFGMNMFEGQTPALDEAEVLGTLVGGWQYHEAAIAALNARVEKLERVA